MAVVFMQGSVITEIGSEGILQSWFSTVCVRLEGGAWGSRFPCVMNSLYQGHLAPEQAKDAMSELVAIRTGLSQRAPSELVWDAESPQQLAPADHVRNPSAISLADYFITANGLNLTDEFVGNVESQLEFGGDLEILRVTLPPRR